jgi:threonylcarbamoyladenosine tRNA methylthiotransferase MtaB
MANKTGNIPMLKTFRIVTLGCKLNYSESSQIARELQEHGFKSNSHPDNYILNTCTVTGIAEKKARSLIAQFHRTNPNAEIIVIGCFAARDKILVENLPGVTKVFGSEDKMNVISHLLEQHPLKTQLTTYHLPLITFSPPFLLTIAPALF